MTTNHTAGLAASFEDALLVENVDAKPAAGKH